MHHPKLVITDHGFPNLDTEEAACAAAGIELVAARCQTAAEVIAASAGAAALLVQWAPVGEDVISALTPECKTIVRYGIGVDNVALAAARARGITVCNVPDYGTNEVAEHTAALALALLRQLPQIDARVRSGAWKIVPDRPMKPAASAVFGTAGFGRIAQAVHRMVSGFGFSAVAYDPYVPEAAMLGRNVRKVDRDDLLSASDVLSLHLPLTDQTRHFIGPAELRRMRPGAILVNTARGALVDTLELAQALQSGSLGGAGIDVFEEEPLPADHPLRRAPGAILTSHVAWYSDESVPRLQRLAVEEAIRGIRSEKLLHPVN